MKSDLRFEDLPNAISLLLDKVDNLEKELENLKDNLQPKKPIELLSRKETASFLKISLVTVSNWVEYGILTSYRMGNRIYFKKSEIIDSMISSKKYL